MKARRYCPPGFIPYEKHFAQKQEWKARTDKQAARIAELGSTAFNVPDLRSFVVAGKSNMGGSDNGGLTGGTVLGAALGGQTVTSSGPTGAASIDVFTPNANVASINHTHVVSTVQPTFILNQIIKT